jgi:hypothetical protein
MTTLLLILLAAYFGFQIGRKWDLGLNEKAAELEEERRAERGRRGTVRLNSIKIKR